MRKKTISLLLVLAFMLAFPGMAYAAPGNNGNGNGNNKQPAPAAAQAVTSFPLHQTGPINWESYWEGRDFGISVSKGEDKLVPGFNLGTEGTGFWHFVNPDKLGGYANITFLDSHGDEVTIYCVKPYKNDQHFGVVTPQDWQLLSAEYFPAGTPKKGTTLFNLSHTAGIPVVKAGALSLTADIDLTYDIYTYQPLWQKTYRPVWERLFEERYGRLYERLVVGNNTNTLVSWLGGGTRGGAFNNGHTYVEVDVASASQPDGVWYRIADSSPSNRPIDYYYNVKVADGKLTISFPDNLFAANVGAYVVADVRSFPGNAPSHHGKTLTVNMPASYGDVVYLYFHNAGGVNWYSETELKLVDPEEWVFIEEYLKDVVWLRDDLVGDAWVSDELVSVETVTAGYDTALANLLVTNAAGNAIYDGSISNLTPVALTGLAPGNYTCVFSYDGVVYQTEVLAVVAGQTTSLAFDTITIKLDDQSVYLDKEYLDPIYLDPIYVDREQRDVFYDPDAIVIKP